MCLQVKSFENIVGKGKVASNEQFLLFLQYFLPICEDFLPFLSNLKLSSANSFIMGLSKICRLGKGKKKRVPYMALLQGIGFLYHT